MSLRGVAPLSGKDVALEMEERICWLTTSGADFYRLGRLG